MDETISGKSPVGRRLSSIPKSELRFLVHNGRRVRISDKMTIGRDRSNDIVIDDALVSRVHCVVRRIRTGWYIEDTGSKNGTWVNEKRIKTGKARSDQSARQYQTWRADRIITLVKNHEPHFGGSMTINRRRWSDLDHSEQSRLLSRSEIDIADAAEAVNHIIQEVKLRGDQALREFNYRFDKAPTDTPIRVPENHFVEAEAALDDELKQGDRVLH